MAGINPLFLTNTLLMRKTFLNGLLLFNATLPLCFCACASNHPKNPVPLNPPALEESPTKDGPLTDVEESPDSILDEEKQPIDPTVWDLSDVDLSEIDPNRKLISFTFDDVPARTLENILAVFASFNEENPDCKASATLFCNGYLFDALTPQTLTAACALGFELGNHTHSHLNLTVLDEATLKEEIDRTDALLYKVDGKPRHLLRAPFGKTNDFVKSQAPVPLIDWTIDTLDWTGVSEDTIYRTVFENRFPGAIALMHDGYKHTVDALKRLLPDLKADGYQVVSVSKMAKMHGCTLKKGSTYIRARKQN